MPLHTHDPLSESVEDYLKAIFHLAASGDDVRPGALAERLAVTPASVSAMLRRLADTDLVARGDGRRVTLTEEGQRCALRVVRRHRLLETFLVQVLDLSWDEVHDEAERLEHALSDRLERRIAAYLGHPDVDPHGDPIPRPDGTHDETWGTALSEAESGTTFAVDRVRDTDAAALRYLGELGVRPGAHLTVERRDPFGGPVWIRIAGATEAVALGEPLTRAVFGTVVEVTP